MCIENLTSALLGFFVFIFVALFIFSAISYVFRAIGLYTMMKKRGFKHPWFAWVPIMCDFSMGAIYDDARKENGIEKSAMRIWMLVISAVIYASIIAFVVTVLLLCSKFADMTIAGIIFSSIMDIIWIAIFMAIILFAMIGLMVIQYVVLFTIYKAYSKSHIALFILTLVIYASYPFVIFALRKYDSENKLDV